MSPKNLNINLITEKIYFSLPQISKRSNQTLLSVYLCIVHTLNNIAVHLKHNVFIFYQPIAVVPNV